MYQWVHDTSHASVGARYAYYMRKAIHRSDDVMRLLPCLQIDNGEIDVPAQ